MTSKLALKAVSILPPPSYVKRPARASFTLHLISLPQTKFKKKQKTKNKTITRKRLRAQPKRISDQVVIERNSSNIM